MKIWLIWHLNNVVATRKVNEYLWGMHYGEYLELDKLLTAQHPESVKVGTPAHDETLFIIVHQVYELWFKQILHELGSISTIFNQQIVDDKSVSLAAHRLERIVDIQKILIDQIAVLETMTPHDFMDFRDLLSPASGFQSVQFKKIENILGLQTEARLNPDSQPYTARLNSEEALQVQETEKQPSLFTQLEKWLERAPFLELNGFSFWKTYKEAVQKMLANDEQIILNNITLDENSKKAQLARHASLTQSFELILNPEHHKSVQEAKQWRLSFSATQAALFILLYREQPLLHSPFRILNSFIDIDENFTTWRHKHALMAYRMIGSKIGTSGSAGADYLARATASHKIFDDLSRLSTFLIPRKLLPVLPENVRDRLSFHLDHL